MMARITWDISSVTNLGLQNAEWIRTTPDMQGWEISLYKHPFWALFLKFSLFPLCLCQYIELRFKKHNLIFYLREEYTTVKSVHSCFSYPYASKLCYELKVCSNLLKQSHCVFCVVSVLRLRFLFYYKGEWIWLQMKCIIDFLTNWQIF